MSAVLNMSCTICYKPIQKINILTEVRIEAYSQYVKPQNKLEDMGGQWKHTKENLCEVCFEKLVAAIQQLHK